MQRKGNAITVKTEDVDVHEIAIHSNPTEEHYPCRVARQVTTSVYSQLAVLVTCRGAGLITIEIHQNVV